MQKCIIFSDFDGTITTYDGFDKIIEDVYSYATYKKLEKLTLEEKLPYELYLEMFNGIQYDMDLLKKDVDGTFEAFYEWVQTQKQNNVEFYIVSAGFKTMIQHILPYVDPSLIYSNDFILNEDLTWKVELYDTLSIRKTEIVDMHRKAGFSTIYLGDGLSDFKVVGKVDHLFCKKGSMLHDKCVSENHPHTVFTDFRDLQEQLVAIKT